MEDLARRAQEWKDKEARILHLEAGERPTDDEIKTITQRTGITKDHWTAWEQAIPRGRPVLQG